MNPLRVVCACLFLLVGTSLARAEADAVPVPAEVLAFKGKLVRVLWDVDVLGGGVPSSEQAAYLTMLLRDAGADVERTPVLSEKKADLLIVGTIDPRSLVVKDKNDPIEVKNVARAQELKKEYEASLPKVMADAKAAGTRVLKGTDVRRVMGIRETLAQIRERLDRPVQAKLKARVKELTIEGLAFSDAINEVRRASGTEIVVSGRAFDAVEANKERLVTLHLTDAALSDVLGQVLKQASPPNVPLAFESREGMILVSTLDYFNRHRR